MKKAKKAKIFLEAAVVIAVALALVMPGTAVVTDTNERSQLNKIGIPDNAIRREIKEVKTWDKNVQSLPLGNGENIQITGWVEGDDVRPTITLDSDDNVFITWEYDESVGTSSAGFSYNDAFNVFDQQAWWDNSVIISLVGLEEIIYPDTALCEHPYYELMGVFLGMDTEEAGGYYIPDVTDYNLWEFYTWAGGAPEPEYAQISDGGWYQDLNYLDVWGPFNFYIYREIYEAYDIPSCPICFHTGIDAASGVGYFDAQSEELTAPASDPDMVNLEDRLHTVLQYTNATTGPHIVWKKIVPAEQPDYEYTPYQATIANGTNPAIAAYDNQVAIVYMDGGNVTCIYSDDDGETWETTMIATGEYPDIYAYDGTFYCTYINDGNLLLVNSTDGGATWTSSPIQVNDVDGSVVAEENSVDIHLGGIVWVDSRGDDYDIYYYQLLPPVPKPKLETTINTGFGLGASAPIKNIGRAAATNVEWTITVTGGLFGLINKETTDTIATLAVDAEETVKSGLIIGLGPIAITLTVTCDEGKSADDSAAGTQLFIFTMVS